MSEFKAGDRVKVEFEGVVRTSESYGSRVLVSDSATGTWVLSESLTKLAPTLPTKVGTVIDSNGFRFVLTHYGWHATIDQNPYKPGEFEDSMYAEDFTVVLEG